MITEHDAQYVAPSKSVRAKKVVQREARLQVIFCLLHITNRYIHLYHIVSNPWYFIFFQMGLSREDMDASKWKSEYTVFCDGRKASMQKQLETSATLRKRRSLVAKKGCGAVAVTRKQEMSEEEEVDGFVLVESPSNNASDVRKSPPGRTSVIFPSSTTEFVSEHEGRFAWPEKVAAASLASSATEEVTNGKKLLNMLGALSPPYALDTDAAAPHKGKAITYALSVEKPLNLFDDSDFPQAPAAPVSVVSVNSTFSIDFGARCDKTHISKPMRKSSILLWYL